jgi:hypothetical protein
VPEGSSDTFDSPEANIPEIFVVGCTAYSRIGKEGQAESSPEQFDALQIFLYNPTGPGLWLLLLSQESFTATGTETTDGFQATRYAVNGAIEEGTVHGDIWQDKQTNALVGASLSISESLFYPPGIGRHGTVMIHFTMEKANMLSISLP